MANEPSRKYLSAASLAALIVAQIAGQHVAGDGGNFQADENDDQVVGRRHQTLASDGKQQQRVKLAGLGVLAIEKTVRGQDGQNSHHHHQYAEERGETVHHQHAAERRTAVPICIHCAADPGQQRQDAEMSESVRGALMQHRVQHHQQRAHHGEDDLRQEPDHVARIEDGASGHGAPRQDRRDGSAL